MPTLDEALNYMGIDYADEMVRANVTRAMATARETLHGAVGEDVEEYLPNSSQVKELILIYADDLYSERGVSAKVSGATRRMVANMVLQLKLKLERAKADKAAEEASV